MSLGDSELGSPPWVTRQKREREQLRNGKKYEIDIVDTDHILVPEVMITKWGWLWWWWWGWWHHSSSESCQRWQPFTSLCLCPTGNSLRWWKIYYRVRDLWSVQCSGVDMGNGLDTWWVIVDESYRSDDEDHDDDNCDVDQFTIHIFVPLSWPNFVWLTHWRSTFEILWGGAILEIQIVDASGVEKPPTTPFMQLTPPPLSLSCFVRSKLILNNH